MGLYSGGLIIGRIFASEIWGAYFREGLFWGELTQVIGLSFTVFHSAHVSPFPNTIKLYLNRNWPRFTLILIYYSLPEYSVCMSLGPWLSVHIGKVSIHGRCPSAAVRQYLVSHNYSKTCKRPFPNSQTTMRPFFKTVTELGCLTSPNSRPYDCPNFVTNFPSKV